MEKIQFLTSQITNLSAIIAQIKLDKGRQGKRTSGDSTAFVLPDWIPADSWNGFEEMRKRIKKPLTDRARRLTVFTLVKLKQQDQDVAACLNQSTQRSWQGVFPVSQNGNGQSHERKLGADW
jgi:hypothetical protein